MSKMGLVGLVIIIILVFGIAGFVFSKVTIDSVFVNEVTGSDALTQSGISQTTLLSWIMSGISHSIGSTASTFWDWITFWN